MAKRKTTVKKTQNRVEYEKQLKRIKAIVKRLEKQGYIVDKDYIKSVTSNKSRITKKYLKELQNIKPDIVRLHSEIIDKETGEIVQVKEISKKSLKEIVNKNIIAEKIKEDGITIYSDPQEYDYLKPRDNTPVTIDILTAIKDRIENMTRKIPMYADPIAYALFPEWKNILLRIIDDNIMSAEMNNELDSLYSYYNNNSSEIFADIDNIEELYYEKSLPSFTRLCSNLNRGSFPDDYSAEMQYAYDNIS